MHITNVEIYVTGSNSKFLSSDIVTEFRGRGDEIRVYPLSFDEFFSVFEGSEEKALNEYYTYGGLPLTLLAKTDNAKTNYLKTQTENVYINDIVERNNIQNKVELEMLVQIIASNIGSLTNPLKLSNVFKERDRTSTMSDKTIYNYLKYKDLVHTRPKIYGIIDYEKNKNIFLLHRLVFLSYLENVWY